MGWKKGTRVLLLILWLAFLPEAFAASAPPPEGGVLPPFELPVPAAPEHREYLGLDRKSVFSIPEIKAEVVIIEIFSMY
ncbi:MAG: hypothetical protein WAK95_21800 [Desulfobacterales bacterium]